MSIYELLMMRYKLGKITAEEVVAHVGTGEITIDQCLKICGEKPPGSQGNFSEL